MIINRWVRVVAVILVSAGPVGIADAQLNKQQAVRIESAVPKKARVAPKESRRVLIWNTPFMNKCPHKGYCVPQAEYAMKLLGERTGAYEPVVSDDVAMYLPENLKRFDAIIMNNSNGPWIRPTEDDMRKFKGRGDTIDAVEKLLRKSFLDWVRNGGGIVAYHHAIGGNTHWPEFHKMIGATYWGHPWNEEVGIKLDEPDHPLLAAFAGRDFRLAEEVFQFNDPWSRTNQRVLMSLDTKTTNMSVPWIHRKDNDFGLAWVRSYGRGRIFYCAIGHRTEHWWNPTILQFYLDGIQFACGDLDADTAPAVPGGSKVEEGFASLFNGKDLSGWTGVLMEYTLRNILAERGQKVVVDADGRINVVGKVGDPTELLTHVNLTEWNDYTVISRKGHTTLKINGVVMCDILDKDPKRPLSGKLALQVHRGPDMLVQFRDIRLKNF